jgi:DNA-binding response OmpR family regulator
VVVFSADATQSRADNILRAGAEDYLTRPSAIRRFLEAVDFALNQGEATRWVAMDLGLGGPPAGLITK